MIYLFLLLLAASNLVAAQTYSTIQWLNYMAAGFILGLAAAVLIQRRQ